jgi:hypothetical protein
MAYLSKGIIRCAIICGSVVGLSLLLSACDRQQPMPTATEQEWQQQQSQPAQPEAQERAAPAWPAQPGE